MIEYGVTHCPHCEKPFATNDTPDGDAAYCPGDGACVTFEEAATHLIAVLQERDALRAELAQVHAGQLSLLVGGA